MSDKDKANDAAAALRQFLRATPERVQQLETIVRYNGELRRNASVLKQTITSLETAKAGADTREQEARREICSLKAELTDLRKQLQPSDDSDPDAAAAAKRKAKKRERQHIRQLAYIDDVLPAPTANAPLAGHTNWTASEVMGMGINPIYAGLAQFPQVIPETLWIKSAARFLHELGPVQFLVNLLHVLRQTMGGPTDGESRIGEFTATDYSLEMLAVTLSRMITEEELEPALLDDEAALRVILSKVFTSPITDEQMWATVARTKEMLEESDGE